MSSGKFGKSILVVHREDGSTLNEYLQLHGPQVSVAQGLRW